MTYGKALTALADPTRRGIFEELRRRPQTVGELAQGQPVSRPAVSQHLKVLRGAGLVSAEPHGNRRLYLVRSEGLAELREYLDSFWTDALTAYSARVTKTIKNP